MSEIKITQLSEEITQSLKDASFDIDDVTYKVSQSFTPDADFDLTFVEVWMRLTGGPSVTGAVIDLCSDDTGEPDTVLATSVLVPLAGFVPGVIVSAGAYAKFAFSTPYAVEAATKYHLVIRYASGGAVDGGNFLRVYYKNSDVLSGGNLLTFNGSVWSPVAADATFRVTSIASVEPANRRLSNLSSTAINQDLSFNKSAPKIKTPTAATDVNSEALALETGEASGTGVSGEITVTTGTSDGIQTGNISLLTGSNGVTASESTGTIGINTGNSSYQSGDITVKTGNGTVDDDAYSGALFLATGDVTGTAQSGSVSIQAGTVETGTRGRVVVTSLGFQIVTSEAEPTADAAYRGMIRVVEGGAGVADSVRICVKTALDTYAWKTVTLT